MGEKNSKNVIFKIIIGVIIGLACIALLVVMLFVGPIRKYHEENTWATIRVEGVVNRETSDAVEGEREYLAHEKIPLDDTTLTIIYISTSGRVEYKVERGELTTREGEKVTEGFLQKGEKVHFRTSHGSWGVEVIQNRYR